MTKWGRNMYLTLENAPPHPLSRAHVQHSDIVIPISKINRYIPVSSRTRARISSLLTLALIKLLMAAKMPISFWKRNSLRARNSFTSWVCKSIQTYRCAFHWTLSIFADTWMKLTDQSVKRNRVHLLKCCFLKAFSPSQMTSLLTQ